MAHCIKTFLFFVVLCLTFIHRSNQIHGFNHLIHNDDPLTISDSDSEVLKLFKIRALGILPQIHNKFSSFQNLENHISSNTNLKDNNKKGKMAQSKKNAH